MTNVLIKASIRETMNSSEHPFAWVRASRHRTHVSGPRRISRTWQWMGVVANPRSYGKCKQVQSYACRILCEITARHNDEESGDQRAIDGQCVLRVAALYPAEQNVNRTISYLHYTSVLNLQDIQFPMTLKDIITFERLNRVSVNVYIIEEQKILPMRLTDDKKEKHIDLLYVQDPRDDNVSHFALIKNLSRFVSSQLSKHNGKKYFCDR